MPSNNFLVRKLDIRQLIMDWKDDKLDPWNSVLARWLLLLGMVDHKNKKVYDDKNNKGRQTLPRPVATSAEPTSCGPEVIAMEDKSLRDAFQNWEELSMTQEQRLAYESRLKHILDEEAFQSRMERLKRETEQIEKRTVEMKTRAVEIEKKAEQKEKAAEQKTKVAEQKTKEAEQKIETFAKRLLAKGMDIEFVAESTGLTKDRIIEIQRNMQE